MLLEVLITIICRESKHIHEDQIQKSLAAFIQRQVHLRKFLCQYQSSQDKIEKLNFPLICQKYPIVEICSRKSCSI